MIWTQLQKRLNENQEKLDCRTAAWSTGHGLTGGSVFCRKGCSGCCTLAVNCTFTEAVSIARNFAVTQELHDHVANILKKIPTVNDLKSYLHLQRSAIGFCPFLEETGACKIYPFRPFSCRALLATKESNWCSVDFTTLSTAEKQQFLASLDRSVVAFPMHYAAMPQEMGRELEAETMNDMIEQFGFSLYGNLPFLVWLESEHNLSMLVPEGREKIVEFLEQNRLDNHFLVSIAP
jgi:Fe-S-cluster containining protein